MNEQEKAIFEKKIDDRINRGFLFVGKNAQGGWDIPSAIASYAEFVELYICRYSGGLVSASAFEIVLREMLASGDLKPIRVEDDKSSEIAQKIADFDAGKISVYQFRLDCKSNRELRDAYERHTGLAQLSQGR